MTNPARDLHTLLQGWVQSGESIFNARGGRAEGDLKFWRGQTQVVGLLREIETQLAGLKALGVDVSTPERYLPTWYRAVFAPRHDWANGKSNGTIQTAELDHLDSVALLLDAHMATAMIEQPSLDDLARTLDEAVELVQAVDGLPTRERMYVLGLIAEARRAVADVETFGTAGARRATIELGGEMVVVASYAQDKSKAERILAFARRLVFYFAGRTTDAVIESGIEGTLGQIGGA